MIVRVIEGGTKSSPANVPDSKGKDFACQTALEDGFKTDIPIFFCTLYASKDEAATQCYIPSPKVYEETVSKPEASQQDPCLETKSCQLQMDHLQQTIEEVIEKARQEEDDDNSFDSIQADDHFDAYEVERPEDQKSTEDQGPASIGSFVAKQGKTPEQQNQTASQQRQSSDQEKKGISQQAQVSKKVKLNQRGEKRKNADSDFSSDDDTEFWKRMAKKQKKIKWTGWNRHRWRGPQDTQEKGLQEDPVTPINTAEEEDVQKDSDNMLEAKIMTSKEGDEMSQTMDDGDWITDDEEDEENFDLESAFRDELKKKRLPVNSKEKNFICEVCGKQYSKNHLLREHIVRSHQDHQQAKKYPFQCKHCRRVYSGEKQLQTHYTQFSGPCEICGVVVGCSGLFWLHRRNHESECSICNKVFSAKATLEMHMKTKHMEKRLSCPECPKRFAFQSQMSKHMQNVHNQGGAQVFACKECNFITNRKTALRAHDRAMHRIRKVYSCSGCEGTFKRRSSLENHNCGGNRQGQFSCKICFKAFISFSDLCSHEKSTHGGQVTVGMPSEAGILNQDIQTYSCQVCHTTFVSGRGLRIHALKVHGLVIEDMKESEQVEEESIQVTEGSEATEVAFMHIDVNNDGKAGSLKDNQEHKQEDSILGLDTTSDGLSTIRSALSLPAYVVPPDVSMVEIDGVQYHVIRGNQ
ncbi:LOW QUALITY PROTEIN: zinc finger protein 791-like [Penaeus monodon]|uniref:LOW QUALITY PROTEIN: zinc finger protein 791-like n=1 Tax=Penaeus monodon TaxID=6687 RepID=UPI0018A6E74F|nr:LOW QUALITY PROTEIN: zinc finger protein 791-like [Penaeus monodon]